VARFRLRFHLQEVDLRREVTLIGRGADCDVALDDAGVSRRHAQICVAGLSATLEDLGSRNGVRLNGLPVVGVVPLSDGDRIRVGSQELVFTRVESTAAGPLKKTTGGLRVCHRCERPYPKEASACPRCGDEGPTADVPEVREVRRGFERTR
jgi:pSer/pThr/pTyr-binding forkhead associated (FHA) protein